MKDAVISFRVSKKEKQDVKKVAKKLKKTVSTLCYDFVIGLVEEHIEPEIKLSDLRPPPAPKIFRPVVQNHTFDKSFLERPRGTYGDNFNLIQELKQVLKSRAG